MPLAVGCKAKGDCIHDKPELPLSAREKGCDLGVNRVAFCHEIVPIRVFTHLSEAVFRDIYGTSVLWDNPFGG